MRAFSADGCDFCCDSARVAAPCCHPDAAASRHPCCAIGCCAATLRACALHTHPFLAPCSAPSCPAQTSAGAAQRRCAAAPCCGCVSAAAAVAAAGGGTPPLPAPVGVAAVPSAMYANKSRVEGTAGSMRTAECAVLQRWGEQCIHTDAHPGSHLRGGSPRLLVVSPQHQAVSATAAAPAPATVVSAATPASPAAAANGHESLFELKAPRGACGHEGPAQQRQQHHVPQRAADEATSTAHAHVPISSTPPTHPPPPAPPPPPTCIRLPSALVGVRLATEVGVALAAVTPELLPQVAHALREVALDAAVIDQHVVHLEVRLRGAVGGGGGARAETSGGGQQQQIAPRHPELHTPSVPTAPRHCPGSAQRCRRSHPLAGLLAVKPDKAVVEAVARLPVAASSQSTAIATQVWWDHVCTAQHHIKCTAHPHHSKPPTV